MTADERLAEIEAETPHVAAVATLANAVRSALALADLLAGSPMATDRMRGETLRAEILEALG